MSGFNVQAPTDKIGATREVDVARIARPGQPSRGKLVTFIEDDGKQASIDALESTFTSAGVPLNLAVCLHDTLPGAYSNTTYAELKRVQDLGWEILSHSVTHPNTILTMSTEDLIYELEHSQANGIANGLDVRGFVYPYGDYTNEMVKLLGRYYDCAFNVGSFGLPNGHSNICPIFEKNIYRRDFDSTGSPSDSAELDSMLAYAEDVWIVYMCHTYANPGNVARIAAQIAHCQSQGYEIVTASEGFRRMRNLVSTNPEDAPGGNSFMIGADGSVNSFGNMSRLSSETYTDDSYNNNNGGTSNETEFNIWKGALPLRDPGDFPLQGLSRDRMNVIMGTLIEKSWMASTFSGAYLHTNMKTRLFVGGHDAVRGSIVIHPNVSDGTSKHYQVRFGGLPSVHSVLWCGSYIDYKPSAVVAKTGTAPVLTADTTDGYYIITLSDSNTFANRDILQVGAGTGAGTWWFEIDGAQTGTDIRVRDMASTNSTTEPSAGTAGTIRHTNGTSTALTGTYQSDNVVMSVSDYCLFRASDGLHLMFQHGLATIETDSWYTEVQ